MPGTYVQLNQLVLVPMPYLLEALADSKRPTEVDPAIWAGVQAHVGTIIESRLGQRYATPFTGSPEPIPPIVPEAALLFAYEAIYQRRGVSSELNPWSSQANAMRAKLDRIATGAEELSPQENRANPSGNVISSPAVTHGSGRRIFF